MFTNTLSSDAANALVLLGKANVLPERTYLAGGTALALQLGHRISIDFDFFTQSDFNQKTLIEAISRVGKFSVDREAKDTLLGTFAGISFSIFTYHYPLLYPAIPHGEIDLADFRDIAAMKVAAIMDRGSKKDFVDLYLLAKHGLGVPKWLELYDRKYGSLVSNLYSIILGLGYFDEAEETAMPKMIKKVSWADIKTFFKRESLQLGKKYL